MLTHQVFSATCYAIGALAYLAFALQITRGSRLAGRGGLLLLAAITSAIWEFSGLWLALQPSPALMLASFLADGLRIGIWCGFVLVLLPQFRVLRWEIALKPMGRWLGSAGLILTLWGVYVGSFLFSARDVGLSDPSDALFGASVAAAVVGLSLSEQLYRGTPESARWGIKPLCLGLAATSAFDLFMFSDALVTKVLDGQIWTVRGLIHALAIPLFMVATARNKGWTIDLSVSRTIVFRSTALVLSGLYMLIVAGAGYYVRFFGGDWGRAFQVTLFFVAMLLLALVLLSGSVRARLRVFINKNFFSYRYDYREEWLRFTRLLSGATESSGIEERSIRALADLVESPAGVQWWKGEEERYRPVGAWNASMPGNDEPQDAAFVQFMARTGWVIDIQTYRTSSARYPGLELPLWLTDQADAWLLIPLFVGDSLDGFVLLTSPRTPLELNWEVLDLLKTAARQAATVIGQVRATEALVEAQQFGAFNRMSAFVVHDLKNLVAQLSLMLKNAERHSANPEFQNDMRLTIEHVVDRMNRLLQQLRSGTAPIANVSPVDVAEVVARISGVFAKQGRRLEMELTKGLWAMAHEERLERVIGHLVQNAFDATGGKGIVKVATYVQDGAPMVEVRDDGKGMSPEFIRNELFKPFRSTKETGMGIGAYESRQYLTEIGGRVIVDSTEGVGTTFRVLLPARPGQLEGERAGDRVEAT
ncbi:MAG: XrtA/PEP-CTERM system histidine kinase PrsK [Burkholderiales bacterium]